MAQMDSRIPMMGQQPNFLDTMATANQAAAQQTGFARQNQLNALYRDQGAQIAQGDQGALNALAGFDPSASLGIQTARLGMDQTRQSMAINQEELGMRREQSSRQAQEHVAKMDDYSRKQQAEQIRAGLVAAGKAFDAGDEAAFTNILQQAGVEPFPMAEFPYKAAEYAGVLDALKAAGEYGNPPKPDYAVTDDGRYYDKNNPAGGAQLVPGMFSGAEWEVATPKEAMDYGATGGQINRRTGEFKRTPTDKAMTLESDGKGGLVFRQGPEGGKDQTDPASPSSAASMINTIDGILNDPALDSATGLLAWTQSIPGTDQRRFGARTKQLGGQAFLQAFESLKGAGQITEVEGQKATEAMGRLDTGQSGADYRQALIELKDILSVAAKRPVGWAEQQNATPPETPTITDDAGYNSLPSGTTFIAPDGSQRRKP
jgi:hypothetical protein